MKRYVLLVGGTGARLADALICAASAGVFPAEKLEVLLADTDRRGVRSAGLVAAKMADYHRVHQAMQGTEGPFRRMHPPCPSLPKALRRMRCCVRRCLTRMRQVLTCMRASMAAACWVR